MKNAIEFENISRHFGDVIALDNINITIKEGEFFAMLGPSGSGKTTSLRLISGFDRPTSGKIKIFGKEMQSIPPYKRPVNTVFQDYALFPHMSVLENVAYSLLIKGVKKKIRVEQALEALDMVQLKEMESRKPSQLSGGQRQRVALARALISEPKVLLLDEPLGALDLKLRVQMQTELKSLQKKLGITFVFVTHDQTEALSMADRVAIFNDGGIMQVGTPEQIYQKPANKFVADFVGSSNIIAASFFGNQKKEWGCLRPEAIRLNTKTGRQATVVENRYLGASVILSILVDGVTLDAEVNSSSPYPKLGESVMVDWNEDSVHFIGDD